MDPLTTGLILGGVSLGSGLLNYLITSRGAKEQAKEGEETRQYQRETFERTFAEEKRASRTNQKIAKRRMKLDEDMFNFNQRQSFVNNFLTGLNQNPNARESFIGLSRGRR